MTNDYSWGLVASPDYLAHYGTKGMKWGERKYQLADGTLTPAGRARYYRNLNGKTQSLGSRIKASITGKYSDGTETYEHYRRRAAKAGHATARAENSSSAIAQAYYQKKANKYGKGMDRKTLEAGAEAHNRDAVYNSASFVAGALVGSASKRAANSVASLTNDYAAASLVSFGASYLGSSATQRYLSQKIYGDNDSKRSERDIASSYEKNALQNR